MSGEQFSSKLRKIYQSCGPMAHFLNVRGAIFIKIAEKKHLKVLFSCFRTSKFFENRPKTRLALFSDFQILRKSAENPFGLLFWGVGGAIFIKIAEKKHLKVLFSYFHEFS